MHTVLITAGSILTASALALSVGTPPTDPGLVCLQPLHTSSPVTVTVDGVTILTEGAADGTTTITLPDGRTVTVTVDEPKPAPVRDVYEIVFALDTTGSMGGLIEGAKQRIWTIAAHAQQQTPKPEIRIGLVGYRDRTDTYVTRVTPLTADIDAVYADLMAFRADGGGDTPESVNEALEVAFDQVGWSDGEHVRRVVYLVGDAPPNQYQDDTDYQESVPSARQRGITVHAIQCGNISGTEHEWRNIAQLGGGSYAAVDQDGGATIVPTPFDKLLSDLNRELSATIVPYGEAVVAARAEAQADMAMELDDAAPATANATRAFFRMSNAAEMIGAGDLITQLDTGTIALGDVDPELVRGDLQGQTGDALRSDLEALLERRRTAQLRIAELSAERSAWLAENAEAMGAGDGFDDFIANTLHAEPEGDAAPED